MRKIEKINRQVDIVIQSPMEWVQTNPLKNLADKVDEIIEVVNWLIPNCDHIFRYPKGKTQNFRECINCGEHEGCSSELPNESVKDSAPQGLGRAFSQGKVEGSSPSIPLSSPKQTQEPECNCNPFAPHHEYCTKEKPAKKEWIEDNCRSDYPCSKCRKWAVEVAEEWYKNPMEHPDHTYLIARLKELRK